MDITFKFGHYQQFVARRSFTLGTTGIQLVEGMPVEFDGTNAVINGEKVSVPGLRGAVKTGWVVPQETYASGLPPVAPVSAGIQVRHATEHGDPTRPPTRMGIDTVEEDEMIVGSRGQHVRKVDETAAARTAGGKFVNSKGMPVDVEAQDGVPVRRLKTSAQSAVSLDDRSYGEAMRQTKIVIEPGQGRTEAEVLAAMPPDQREEYLARKASLRAQYVEAQEAQVVGTVKKAQPTSREGISIANSVGGGIEIADMGGTGGEAPTQTVSSEGITFQQTNGPKRDAAQQVQPEPASALPAGEQMNHRVMVAKMVCPDFPDSYDFNAPARKRLARLALDFDDQPQIIKAAWAAESDDMKAAIQREFPHVF